MKLTKFFNTGSVLLVCVGSLTVAGAATLTNIPMQGGMVMPKLSYNAISGRVSVAMTAVVPELTPLLVSHPQDRFDPADPWFGTLDPGADGLAFSRRYGFVMSGDTDLRPPNTQIWIRKLSGSPELLAYRHQTSEPKAFEPIFGTDGVTNAMYWNGMMFHPVFAAPPGTNTLSATFEAYLLDVSSGQEIADSSSGPFTLEWTNMPDGKPRMNLAPGLVVSWPDSASASWRLEGAIDLNGSWTALTNEPLVLEGQKTVVLRLGDERRFFRMKWEP